jgi:hypothetical protein
MSLLLAVSINVGIHATNLIGDITEKNIVII